MPDTERPRSRATLRVVARTSAKDATTSRQRRPSAKARRQPPSAAVLERMTLSQLCAHFAAVEHVRVRRHVARLADAARQFDASGRASAPWIASLQTRIATVRDHIIAHLRVESKSLFPLLRRLENDRARSAADRTELGRLITQMRVQHNEFDEALDALATSLDGQLAAKATSPRERTLLVALQRLENRIHEQIYRENQILFRRAIALAVIR